MEQDSTEATPLITTSTPSSNRKHFRLPSALSAVSVIIACLSLFFFFSSTSSTLRGEIRDVVPTLQSSAALFSSRSKRKLSQSQSLPSMARNGTKYDFLCVGDWGREGILPQKLVAESLARTALATSTIISTGDNFYNHGVKTVSDKRWSKSYEDVYGAQPELRGLDFLPVLGNHDHLGDPLAQVLYTRVSETWKLPARYSAKIMRHGNNGIVLVRLDTTPYASGKSGRRARRSGFVPDPQTLWFEQVMALAEEHSMYALVVGHHNMYSGSTCGHKGTHHLRNALEHILVRYRKNILAYLCGHEHALMHMRKHGIDHIVSGGGSLLDPICRPNMTMYDNNAHDYRKKMKHRGVLNMGNGAKFVKSTNGFFKVEFDSAEDKLQFRATAINEKQEILYSFEKKMDALRPPK